MKDLSECRVLIVDDVKANVDVLVQALRGEYKLSVALDGEGALRSAAKDTPDLVLLDIMMPGIDGYEVCRRLRAGEQTRDIPVMFLTSLEDVQDKARGFEIGGNDYLTKPFEILEVKARVRSLVRAKAYADAIRAAQETELNIAREIQMGILASDLSSCTIGTGLDIHAVLKPAQHVGGDLYEVLRTDEDRVMVVLGDVSGKGIPAALFMAVTVTLVRSMARQYDRPEEIVRRVSDELASHNPRNMFVTMACLIYDLRSGQVTCANAGHNAMALFGPGKPPRFVFPSSGIVAGLFPGNDVRGEVNGPNAGRHIGAIFRRSDRSLQQRGGALRRRASAGPAWEGTRADRRRDGVQHSPGGQQPCSRSPPVRRHLDCRGALLAELICRRTPEVLTTYSFENVHP